MGIGKLKFKGWVKRGTYYAKARRMLCMYLVTAQKDRDGGKNLWKEVVDEREKFLIMRLWIEPNLPV